MTKVKRCSQCGKEVSQGGSFCPFCGNIINENVNFIGQELELYSFDTKLTTLSFSEEDIYPFFSYIYSESEKDKVEKAYCMSNAVDMYCKIFKPDY